MNDDDLEKRLGRWFPADPPAELMRRLRTAEPPATSGKWFARLAADFLAGRFALRRWPLPGAVVVVLAASIVIFAGWPKRPMISTAPAAASVQPTVGSHNPDAGNPEVSERTVADSGPGRGRGASFDVGGFANPDLRYAVVDISPEAAAGGGFHLETPAVPIRLDCGYTLPGSESNHSPGKFNLNTRGEF